jgi:hypothetical protein
MFNFTQFKMKKNQEKQIKLFREEIHKKDSKIEELEYLIHLLTMEKYYEC